MSEKPAPAPELGPTGSPITTWSARDVSHFSYVAGFIGIQPKWVADFVCADGTRGFAGFWGDRMAEQPGWGFAYWTPGEARPQGLR